MHLAETGLTKELETELKREVCSELLRENFLESHETFEEASHKSGNLC